MSLILSTPEDVSHKIAERAREARLKLNLSQEGLARRAGISAGTVKRFEKTGQISMVSLLQMALVLGSLDNFEAVFKSRRVAPTSIDELIKEPRKVQRGRLK